MHTLCSQGNCSACLSGHEAAMSNTAPHSAEEVCLRNSEAAFDDPATFEDHNAHYNACGHLEYESLTTSRQMLVWWFIENCQRMWWQKNKQLQIEYTANVWATELLCFLEWTGAALWSDRQDTRAAMSMVHQFCSMFSKVVQGLSDGRLPVQATSREDLRANFNVNEFIAKVWKIDPTPPKCMEDRLKIFCAAIPEGEDFLSHSLSTAQKAVQEIDTVLDLIPEVNVCFVRVDLTRVTTDFKDLKMILEVFQYRKLAAQRQKLPIKVQPAAKAAVRQKLKLPPPRANR